ncbi:MAG: nucleotidyltransferase [Limosilactobacillus sp.]|uniref:nucleotidyltransferase n=1 Tax=Limosilactobacillus sp. TaxID=2773925 RepID=UPI0027033D36|nr:nucleotidyltransferase [Limosilactobacillus sp.]
MQAVGMVVEFNPFHNGHKYYVQQAKEQSGADVSVAVMSGNFTQRGEPTIVDKWQRTQAALANGVDLVVELPVFSACQPAHRFAAGALSILNELGVSTVAFGAEHPDWDFLSLVKASESFSDGDMKNYTATYATQFNSLLSAQTGVSLTDPNDILSFAYNKAAYDNGYQFDLMPIQRVGSDYHDERISGEVASASAIRKAITDGTDYSHTAPAEMLERLAEVQTVPSWQTLYPLLRNQLIQAPVEQLRQTYQMAEGLEYRMKDCAQRSLDFDHFIHGVKTKRYTFAHLLRLCLYTTLQITEEELAGHVAQPYIHILGFTKKGQEYLHQVKKQVEMPLFTKVDQDMKDELCALDYRAGKLYQTFTAVEQDLKHAPIILR